MNEYKEQCNIRKDQLHTKDPKLDIEPSKKGKRKKKKNIRIIAIPTMNNRYFSKPDVFGKYETLKDAKQAFDKLSNDIYYTKYYTFYIEE